MENDVEEYYSLGIDGYIQKPIDRQMLISTIAKFFNSEDDNTMSQANSVLGNVDMSDLVSEFKTSLVTELEQFITETNKRDVDSLRDLAHRLSGTSQMFGFTTLSQKAATLEKNIQQGNQSFEDIQPDLNALIYEIRRVLIKEIDSTSNG